ncbi:MAG: carbonic anhydrase [Paracoccaceae bacterium]
MKYAKPLPSYLVDRYLGWKATKFSENKAWYARLAEDGQRPRAMVISCCDSRVDIGSLFGAESGEFFIHRNIANLVPPNEANSDHHGTSAAIEYAVLSLKVAHLIVIGHSHCGGIQACRDMCRGAAPELEQEDSYVGRWMDLLRPGFARVAGLVNEAEQTRALEHQGVIVSLENLMTFPFVRGAVEEERLTLHGVWHDIATGEVEFFDSDTEEFIAV